MFDAFSAEFRFAVEAVRAAALLAREVEAELVESALTKDDRSPVTVADFAVQALVACLIEQSFPEIPLVAEEDSEQLREEVSRPSLVRVADYVGRRLAYATPETVCAWIDRGAAEPGGRFWVLDPIDGTKGFLRGDQYAVCLALVEDGAVRLGAMGCPNLAGDCVPGPRGAGVLVAAERGRGAWAMPLDGGAPARLRVSDVRDVRDVRLLRSFETGHTNVGRIEKLAHELGIAAEPVRMDSQAKYAVLAAGRGELLLRLLTRRQPDYRERIWDQAAGSVVVEEAGGRVTDLDGKALDFTAGRTLARNRGVCASNGFMHDAALEVLAAIDPPA